MQIPPCVCMHCMQKMHCPYYYSNLSIYSYSPYEPDIEHYRDSNFAGTDESDDKAELNSRIANFTGTWSSTMGVLEMTQDGNNVKGIYPTVKTSSYFKNWTGKLSGTVSGDTMTGTWAESRYPGQHASGKFRFRLLADGKHFLGTRGEGDSFTDGKWGGPWDGHRI